MDGAPMIRIDRVSRSFDGVTALDDVSLEIPAGTFFSLLGPSGCGKTTLLRMIAGLDRPDSGRTWIDGTDMTEVPAHRRPVNTVFQSYALFPHLSVRDNVAFGLRQEGIPRDEVSKRTAGGLALARLDGLERRRPHELSGGQRQRVALARALVKRPKILLLDEPLAALDRRLREHTRFELQALHREVGITFVMVTHDQEEAMSLSQRIAVMDGGRVVQVGTPEDLYERPGNRFVAAFVGDANFLPVTLRAVTDGHAVVEDAAGNRFGVSAHGVAASAAGSRFELMLRPERMAAAPRRPDSGNALPARIAGFAYLGSAVLLRALRSDGQAIEARIPAVGVVGPPPRIGDDVWLTWPDRAGVLLAG
jgi:putrescine transport system ATP-binding protein